MSSPPGSPVAHSTAASTDPVVLDVLGEEGALLGQIAVDPDHDSWEDTVTQIRALPALRATGPQQLCVLVVPPDGPLHLLDDDGPPHGDVDIPLGGYLRVVVRAPEVARARLRLLALRASDRSTYWATLPHAVQTTWSVYRLYVKLTGLFPPLEDGSPFVWPVEARLASLVALSPGLARQLPSAALTPDLVSLAVQQRPGLVLALPASRIDVLGALRRRPRLLQQLPQWRDDAGLAADLLETEDPGLLRYMSTRVRHLVLTALRADQV